jgi:N-acetylglucosaminyl-diphospho-decaprenol L-rhamnosyltransferase
MPVLNVVRGDIDLDVGVIYTYERAWMPRLLPSLCASGQGLAMRLLLVDNASADGAGQWEGHFPATTVLRNSQRLHYSANLNRILAASTAPYVLLLNTDLLFDDGQRCLTKMVEFMERRPECGIAGCQVYHPDGSPAYPARRFQDLRVIVSRRLGLARAMPGALDRYFYRDRDPAGAWACDWLSGCFMLLRRRAVEQVGPFDAGFVKYFEDVDICLRMARAGWLPMYNGRTYCYHLEGRASKRVWSRDAWHHARSYLRWLGKWGFSPARHIPAPRPDVEPRPQRRAA